MFSRLTTLMLAAVIPLATACTPTAGDARAVTSDEPGTRSPAALGTRLVDAPDEYVSVNGVTIRYRTIGAGEPAVLLHGYTDGLEMWAGPADSLARDFRVIALDLRGFGRSTKSGDAARYGRQMVRDVVALLDRLEVESAHVLGYSMGALLAANLALEHPARVRSATFVAGPFYRDSAESARALLPFADALERGEGLTPFFQWILPTWSDSAVASIVPLLTAANDSASLVASLRALPGLMFDSTRAMSSGIPTASIVSNKDPLVPLSRDNARHWPGISHVEIPTHDHADIHLAPEVLREFRRVAGGS